MTKNVAATERLHNKFPFPVGLVHVFIDCGTERMNFALQELKLVSGCQVFPDGKIQYL